MQVVNRVFGRPGVKQGTELSRQTRGTGGDDSEAQVNRGLARVTLRKRVTSYLGKSANVSIPCSTWNNLAESGVKDLGLNTAGL